MMTTENPYRIHWNRGYYFQQLQEMRNSLPTNPVRIITIQTEKSRVCLMASDTDGFYYLPYQYDNGAWRRIDVRSLNIDKVTDEIFESEAALYTSLERQMLLQFRYSAAGYYSDLPTRDAVTSAVLKDSTVGGLKRSLFSYYQATVEEDPDYDGAFEVFCEEGSLLIPYVGHPRDEDTILLSDYITFVKAHDTESVLDRLGKRLDNIVGFVGNIHWSNLRNKLEGVWD